MTRGRKPLAPPEKINVQVNEHAVRQSVVAISEDAKRLAHIEELYGDGDPFDPHSCGQKYDFLMNTSSEAFLEAGKQLIRYKEHQPHGEFLKFLERRGVDPRFAQRQMQATAKFCRPNARLTAHLNKTKLLELMIEDDQTIDSLEKGGTLYGLTLDDIECMSSTELRQTLRAERQKCTHETEASERLIADKNKKLDELARIKPLPEALTELQIECAKASGAAIGAMQRFTQIRLAATDLLNGDARDRNDDIVRGAIGATHLQLLWQLQAWLTEEMQFAEMVFGGTKIEIRARDERGPDLTEEEIARLKDAGAEEATRVVQLAKAGANH